MKKIFNISQKQVDKIVEMRLDLNMLYALENLGNGANSVWLQSLKRRGFVDEKGEITLMGITVLQLIKEGAEDIVEALEKKIENQLKGFNLFWSEFPAHNGWGKFEKTRALRRNEKTCEKLFEDAVKEGKYTAEQIIQGMKNHVAVLKKKSKPGDNQLSYLQNSETYLRQRSYEVFIGDDKETGGKSKNVVDI